MIHLFTDFGWAGPYAGEMRAVLARDLPDGRVIDLMHDAPMFNPKAGAYLLAALSKRFAAGDICLAVVDPGVGDQRRKAVIVQADGIQYVGPDNGLFAIVVRHASDAQCHEILWRPDTLSDTFHGRDLFAPVVNRIARAQPVEKQLLALDAMIGNQYPDDLAEIIYLDHYGNAVTGLRANRYTARSFLRVMGEVVPCARTFSSVQPGEAFWYANSMGLVEIAVNRVSAGQKLQLAIGSKVEMSS